MRRRSIRIAALGAVGAASLLAGPTPADAQELSLRDFVVTGGLSSEGYQGNLPSVGITVRDSTEFASAMVGEFGLRGEVLGSWMGRERLSLAFDGGLRQFSARGFQLRDYAPREWAGSARLQWGHPVGEASLLTAGVEVHGRDVQDRPPMPLFLQPGQRGLALSGGGHLVDGGERRWDVEVRGEWLDFLTPVHAPQIRLLDRRSAQVELGLRPGLAEIPGDVRLHFAAERAGFPEQRTFLDDDPHRRDRAFRAGLSWTWQGPVLAQLAVEGRVNRSNSRRPEYDAGTVRGLLSASLPGDVALTGYLALTAKRYLYETEFARLIPGEEANSASQAYLSLTRALAANLDGTVRLGWTRAETEIGGQYFQRYGGSVLVNFRPGL